MEIAAVLSADGVVRFRFARRSSWCWPGRQEPEVLAAGGTNPFLSEIAAKKRRVQVHVVDEASEAS